MRTLIALCALIFTIGCAGTHKAVVTVTSVVDTAMQEWADASVSGRTTPKLDAEVKAAHALYREQAARALVLYQAAVKAGDAQGRMEALRTLKDAAELLLDELFPVLPAESLNAKDRLEKAVAP